MWRFLHLLSVLSVPFVLTFMMGCIKAKEEKADLGPEIDFTEIQNAVSKAVQGNDVSNTAVGHFVNYSYLRRLEQEENTINLGYLKVNVIRKTEEPTYNTFTLRIEKATRLADNTFETKISQDDFDAAKPGPVPTAMEAFDVGGLSSYARAAAGAPAKKPTKESYHRLRESTGMVAVPNVVKTRPGCGGLSPCEIPATFIQFDFVQWFNDGTYQKVAVDLAFSTKTPFLPFGQNFDQLTGLLITDCRATVIPVEGRTVYVRDCLSLEDFQK